MRVTTSGLHLEDEVVRAKVDDKVVKILAAKMHVTSSGLHAENEDLHAKVKDQVDEIHAAKMHFTSGGHHAASGLLPHGHGRRVEERQKCTATLHACKSQPVLPRHMTPLRLG